jgi:hypothetical protein
MLEFGVTLFSFRIALRAFFTVQKIGGSNLAQEGEN